MTLPETKIKDIDWKDWEKRASKMSKDELIRFISKKNDRSKRELEKKLAIEKKEVTAVDNYIAILNSISKSSFAPEAGPEKDRQEKGMKYFEANERRRKQIKDLEEEKKVVLKNITEIRKPKQDCIDKKKEAKKSITKKILKKIYKFFENDSDPVAVALFEIFVGCLRGVEKGSREDVELYLRAHKGLMISMEKLKEKSVNRDHASRYAEVLKKLKEPIEDREYVNFIPFYVWMDNVLRIIKYSIDEKHKEEELQQKEDSIFKLNHEIERAQIVLDHLGIDPKDHDHYKKIVGFWRGHLDDINLHINKNEETLQNFGRKHIEQTLNKVKRHGKEEKSMTIKREYPVMGENDELDHIQVPEQKQVSTSKNDDSDEEDNDDSKTPDESRTPADESG
jgi:hypothetical protein